MLLADLQKSNTHGGLSVNVPRNDRFEILIKEIQRSRALARAALGEPPMVPRPFCHRPRPNTAIITEAAVQTERVRLAQEEAARLMGAFNSQPLIRRDTQP